MHRLEFTGGCGSFLWLVIGNKSPDKKNLLKKKKKAKKAIWSGTLWNIFFILCFVLLVCCVSCCFFSWYALVAQFAHAICLAWLFTHIQLCLVVHFFILPFHMLGSLHTCCLPLSCNPTCSPKAVEFSTGGIVRLRDAAGEGQPEGLVVVLYWHLLLFPWVYRRPSSFGIVTCPAPPFLPEASYGSRSLVHLCLLMKGLLVLTATAPLLQGGFWQLQEWQSC